MTMNISYWKLYLSCAFWWAGSVSRSSLMFYVKMQEQIKFSNGWFKVLVDNLAIARGVLHEGVNYS